MKRLIIFAMLFLIIPAAYSSTTADLHNYQDYFFTLGEFNGYTVVGENATSKDVVSASKILSSFELTVDMNIRMAKGLSIYPDDFSILDSEISSTDYPAVNVISIGSLQENSLNRHLLGKTEGTYEDYFEPGQSLMKIIRYGPNVHFVISGYDADAVGKAVDFLVTRSSSLKGKTEYWIEGTEEDRIKAEAQKAIIQKQEEEREKQQEEEQKKLEEAKFHTTETPDAEDVPEDLVQELKPNIFGRFWDWLKGLFS